jgi:hypothetical protein
MPIAGPAAVSAALALAERRRRRNRPDADPAIGEPLIVGEDKLRPGEWLPDADGLPPQCPVQVLGMDGDILYLVDAMGQLAACEPATLGQKYIQRLFGDRQRYLYWAWPRFSKDAEIVSWRAEKAAECFYTAAGRKELFSPLDHVRGRGAWATRRGELIFHSGDLLWRGEERDRQGHLKPREAGPYEGDLYPRRPPIIAPWPEKVTPADNPARELLRGLKSWRWGRPAVDPVLMLGWIGAALLGGALPYRATVFLVGDFQTGKSSLQNAVKDILGDTLVKVDDTTAAGVYSKIKQDSLPVAVDEIEAEADNRKTMAVVKLARLAYSGGTLMRGSQDQTNNEFKLRSAFLFSAINAPPLKPQDLSRMAVLNLKKFDVAKSDEKPPVVDAETWGPMILRTLMDNWPRFRAANEAYRDALRAGGHDGRGQDTFAALLACADLLLGPELLEEFGLPVEDLSWWSEALAVKTLGYEITANWRGCLTYLMTARVEAWRAGAQHTVGAILDHMAEAWSAWSDKAHADDELKKVRAMLAQADLGLLAPGEFDDGWTLAIPNESQLVAQLFRDSDWAGVPGASVWKSALRQAPGPVVSFDPLYNRVRINGVQRRCTLVRLAKLEEG